MATIKELEELVKKLNDDLQALKVKQNSGRWVPDAGEVYYYVDSALVVVVGHNYNFVEDQKRILVGNCYKTQEEAGKERDRMIAIAEVNQIIREENGDWVPDWNDSEQLKQRLAYDYKMRKLTSIELDVINLELALEDISENAIKKVISRIRPSHINKIWLL